MTAEYSNLAQESQPDGFLGTGYSKTHGKYSNLQHGEHNDFFSSRCPDLYWYCFKKCVWTEVHQLLRLCKYINISVKAG